MTASEVKDIIINNKDTMAFVIGNGINRFFDNGSFLSWNELLKQVWNKYSSSINILTSNKPNGISNTEYIDALEIELLRKGTTNISILKQDIASLLYTWPSSTDINTIVGKIKAMNVPILTPNYDSLFEKAFPIKKKIMKMRKKSTDFYPWNYYYGKKGEQKLNNPIDGFGIWHIHGMIEHPRSIRIGLNDYMGLVEKSRNMIQKHYLNLNNKAIAPTNTWFDIIFQKSLLIVGFGLEKDEIFFRWLLLQRAKYQVLRNISLKGWYITFNNSISDGQKMFMKSIGFTIIDMNNYKDFYEDVWSLI